MNAEQRRMLSETAFAAAGGWAILAAIMILARLGLWAFWPVLLVIGLVIAGLTLSPATGKTKETR